MSSAFTISVQFLRMNLEIHGTPVNTNKHRRTHPTSIIANVELSKPDFFLSSLYLFVLSPVDDIVDHVIIENNGVTSDKLPAENKSEGKKV